VGCVQKRKSSMFSLAIPLSVEAVKSIKASLTRSMSEVKSSHRCEAMARGLGFRTHASLRAGVKNGVCPQAIVDGEAFVAYLRERRFSDATAPSFYIACAQVAVSFALEKEPMLCWHGIGFGEYQRRSDGSLENMNERHERFYGDRAKLCSPHYVQQFLRALVVLTNVERCKNITSVYGSYRLKHVAERAVSNYPTGEKLGPDYVSNGAFIAAAIHVGFKWRTSTKPNGEYYPNVGFNMSTRSLRYLESGSGMRR